MNKEKQIEEMANDLCELNRECENCPFQLKGIKCNPKRNAERFIAKGYRKQSEGEWIFKEYGEDTYTNLTRIYECSLCGRTIECLNEADEPYCHCGAKMKGGAEEC